MSDILSIGSSALMAYRQALDVTAHNIANANTPGYVRQAAQLQERPGTTGGVVAGTITRNFDQILSTRLLGDNASFSRLDSFHTLSTRLDKIFSDADLGLATPLQEFYASLNTLAANPDSVAARQTVLSKAETLTARFDQLQAELDSQSSEINSRLSQTVGEINNYATSIADINERIQLAGQNGQAPNDLYDQRDQLIDEISQRIGISTTRNPDGTVNVFTGTGQPLVLGTRAESLSVGPDKFGSGLEIFHKGVSLTAQISGGSIGGLLDYRREMLEPAYNQLGRLAAGLSESVNAQHVQGEDGYGQPGGNLFVPIQTTGLAASSNTGTAAVSMAYTNSAQLGTDDYLLQYDGSAWSLKLRSSGQSIALSGSGTAGDPLVAAGFSMTVSGGASAGDQFLIQPTHDAASRLQLAITDPQHLAAATPGGSDNGNARALAALSNANTLNGGRSSVIADFTAMVTRIGTQTQGAQMSRDAAGAIQQRTLSERDSISGVNLDEEAADLVRFQQAYQAAAQLVQTANEMLQTLMDVARR